MSTPSTSSSLEHAHRAVGGRAPAGRDRKRSVLRWLGIAAAVLVPLAMTGLFVGALGQSDTAIERIPAAIVNSDTMITQTTPEGEDQVVFAGRQLVTELTGSEGFDWTITNADDAEAKLASGEVYAILTVPENFSESILSLQSDSPQRADISIRTDDAHSYLTGSVAQVVGETMTNTFGKAITAQYLGGIFASLGDVGTSLQTAADGAAQLSSGATQLADGAGQLATGASALADGANELASGAGSLTSGLGEYTAGVGAVASGLTTLSDNTAALGDLSAGVAQYTDAVSQLSAGLSALVAADPDASPQLQAIAGGLAQTAQAGPTLAGGAGALPALRDGIAQAASGANALAGGSPALVSGAQQLGSGAQQLGSGAQQLTTGIEGLGTGATTLATGAGDLSTGLADGASQIPSGDAASMADTTDVILNPVGLEVTTDNAVTEVGQGLATFFVPLGLWVGAMAVFLVLRPVSRQALASTARNSRVVAASLGRAFAVTGVQTLLLTALLHTTLGVGWSLLPATLGFSLLTALAFTAFHYLLTVGLGRGGLVISLLLIAIQVASTGGIYPVQVLSEPFQLISGLLPLTYGVQGMQAIIAGASPSVALGAAAMLALFGVLSVVLALVVVRGTRRARALGLVPATV